MQIVTGRDIENGVQVSVPFYAGSRKLWRAEQENPMAEQPLRNERRTGIIYSEARLNAYAGDKSICRSLETQQQSMKKVEE